MALYASARSGATLTDTIMVPPRDVRCFTVPAGHFFRITSVDGPQVGDLNLWKAADLTERFYSGKTRALHGTHITTRDRMWRSFPALRPMATITADTHDWYGIDAYGGSVHDVIGTCCDPYTGLRPSMWCNLPDDLRSRSGGFDAGNWVCFLSIHFWRKPRPASICCRSAIRRFARTAQRRRGGRLRPRWGR